MRIAITADPLIPVPPENYGGIERIIDFLVRGLQQQGHEVALVAHRKSKIDTKLFAYRNADQNWKAHISNVLTVSQLYKFKPDIIHSFGRIAYLLPFFWSPVPKLMSYQREPTVSQIKKALQLVKGGRLSFTGCSNYISKQIEPYATSNTVYNGVDLTTYQANFSLEDNAPLVYLGRIEPIKGTHLAIEIALKSNRNLIIAGNIPAAHQAYFDQQISPLLNDRVLYIGEVNDQQKNHLLRNAAALLMPIQWNEPFGIVMVEAMACGTPVIGLNRGAVSEIVKDRLTGFCCENVQQMIECVHQLPTINRQSVRREVERRFSSNVIVNAYLSVYQSLTNAR